MCGRFIVFTKLCFALKSTFSILFVFGQTRQTIAFNLNQQKNQQVSFFPTYIEIRRDSSKWFPFGKYFELKLTPADLTPQ